MRIILNTGGKTMEELLDFPTAVVPPAIGEGGDAKGAIEIILPHLIPPFSVLLSRARQMKNQFRKPLMKYGRKVLQQVQKGIRSSSLIGDQPFFPRARFEWARKLEQNWHVIRVELDEVLKRREDLPNFQDISPDQKHIAKEDKWKTFFFFAYGLDALANAARCPQTSALLKAVPRAQTAFFFDSLASDAHPCALRPV